MKYYLSFLALFFAFVGLVSSSEDENSLHFKLVQVSGVLHEKKSNQEIMLVIQGKKIEPSFFKQLVLREEKQNEIYFSKLTCDYKEQIYDYSYIKCQINLSQIPGGFYKIALLFYDEEDYRNSLLPPLLILEEKKEEDVLRLVDTIPNITEYYKYQEIKLIFNKDLFWTSKIKALYISNNKSEQFKIYLGCIGVGQSKKIAKCEGDFSEIGGGLYSLDKVEAYYYNIEYPIRNITIRVKERPMYDLKLLNIYGDTYQSNMSMLLVFNGDVLFQYFTSFYLFNSSKRFDVAHSNLQQYKRDGISVDFDFKRVPVGSYNMGLFYRGYDWRFHNISLNITPVFNLTKIGYNQSTKRQPI